MADFNKSSNTNCFVFLSFLSLSLSELNQAEFSSEMHYCHGHAVTTLPQQAIYRRCVINYVQKICYHKQNVFFTFIIIYFYILYYYIFF